MKKSNLNNLLTLSTQTLTIFIFLILGIACSSGVSDTDPEPIPDPPPPINTIDAVAPDGILETVTWNLQYYGDTGRGPSDERIQTRNALQVIDSLGADLYALQEVYDQNELEELTGYMTDYRGFVADHIDYDQRTAFIYNTQTIDSISSGPISELQDEYNWAGRFPLYFRFNYTFDSQDIEVPILAIVIHSKCCGDQESYQRRMEAAESLYAYLMKNEPDANIVFLGDYNDDVDESIYQGSETPYDDFVNDEENFFVVTKSLSEEGISSTTNTEYTDLIDHITVSNEMEPSYQMNSVMVYEQAENFIQNYSSTTSDHYPVIAKFDVRQ